MKTDFAKPFNNDVQKIANVVIVDEVKQAILDVKKAQTLKSIPNLRKLKGYKAGIYFRIRVGRYRIGVTIVGDLVTFARCLPRKNFYQCFP